MPIRWTILHGQRRVVAITQGLVTLKDVEDYLDAVVVANAMPYGKLFDATDFTVEATDHDVLMLGARMRAYVSTLTSGPSAFVVTTKTAREFVDRYINLTGEWRAVKICLTADEAREWLDAQP
ncbi:hypothetical protein BH11PSE3_BH11PSE3_26340 [soil metagenome]